MSGWCLFCLSCPQFTTFLLFVKCIIPFALYGDYLRSKLDPIRITIEVPEETNNIFDQAIDNGSPIDVYCHHLRVKNLTPHRPIQSCRVWLKQMFHAGPGGAWEEKVKFAVPRLMSWAPSEWSKDERTFSRNQVFDLGVSFTENRGFKLTDKEEQGGIFKKHCQFAAGEKRRLVFFVTADNYQGGDEFCFEVAVAPTTLNPEEYSAAVITFVAKP